MPGEMLVFASVISFLTFGWNYFRSGAAASAGSPLSTQF